MDKNVKIQELKKKVLSRELPEHIAITMDGNGRWAKKRFLPRTVGHKEGVNALKRIVEVCGDIKLKYLTVFAFSTENWKRPEDEVNYLLKLLREFLKSELNTLHKNRVKINIWGDTSVFSDIIQEELQYAVEKTRDNDKLILNLALNYGGKADIIKACKELYHSIAKGEINIDDIDEELFSKSLYSKGQPDPNILIRTGGDYRISNFLLYQSAYTELWFSDVYWPSFDEELLYQAILDYNNRDRRFGGV
ncbi:isoprenyl transferase [Abyssisolibacter fermentans]|uniref:isoprenyl transferase n=1 Tax=Abyssisolibacter fermentans TaxID=1766203 RepID=UPI000830846C|nr:isoprenyl transferase [Abyssisolibacter fermentans]